MRTTASRRSAQDCRGRAWMGSPLHPSPQRKQKNTGRFRIPSRSGVAASPFLLPCPRHDEILSPQERWEREFELWGASFLLWVRVFQLAHALDKMKSCRHKERWLNVFPSHVGASFLLWVRVFQLALAFDKMKSCRHKERWVQAFPCGCKFSLVGASFPTCTSSTR